MHDLHHQFLWVEASAGSGKTKTLIDRLIFLIGQGISWKNIICLTFTNAAAHEMYARLQHILKDLNENYGQSSRLHHHFPHLFPQKHAPYAQRLMQAYADLIDLPELIHIQTLHSFCQSILPDFNEHSFHSAQIIEDSHRLILIRKAFNEVVMHLHINNHSIMHNLASIFAPEYIFNLMKERFDKHATTLITSYIAADDNELHKLSNDIASTSYDFQCSVENLNNFLKTLKNADAFLEYFPKQKQTWHDISQWHSVFLTKTGQPRKNIVPRTLGNQTPQLTSILTHLQNLCVTHYRTQLHYQHLQRTHALNDLFYRMHTIYTRLKKHDAVIDYDDLLQHALDGMQKYPHLIWSQGFNHILIDEAQDTPPKQWAILRQLLHPDFFHSQSSTSLTVVGDMKQTIYDFQGASTRHMQAFYNETTQRMRQNFNESECTSTQWHHLKLNKSYRSTPLILQAVNAAFAHELCQHVSPDEKFPLHDADARQHTLASSVQLWPLPSASQNNENVTWSLPSDCNETPHSTEENVAHEIAAYVSHVLHQSPYIESKKRCAQPQDFMVLLSKRGHMMTHLIQALQMQNIPVSPEDRLILTQHLAVQDVISVCTWVMFPYDKLNLASLLKSPLIGMSEDNVFTLFAHHATTISPGFYDVLRTSYANVSQRLNEVQLLFSTAYHAQDFVMKILHVWQARRYLLNAFGTSCIRILDAFESYIHTLQTQHRQTYGKDLMLNEALLHMQHYPPNFKQQQNMNDNCVRVMTIHGAKGLQAPFVILADADSTPDFKDRFASHDNNQWVWIPGQNTSPDNVQTLYKKSIQKNAISHMRLLYVALTRAEQHLIITSSTHLVHSTSWYAILKTQWSQLTEPVPWTSLTLPEQWSDFIIHMHQNCVNS